MDFSKAEDRQDLRGATALHLACEEGHVGAARRFGHCGMTGNGKHTTYGTYGNDDDWAIVYY